MDVREFLFKDWPGCTNGDCVVREPKGMHTNGQCHCLVNAPRARMTIMQGRLRMISHIIVEYDQ